MSNDDDDNNTTVFQAEFSIEEIHQILGEGDPEKLKAVQAFLDKQERIGIRVVRRLSTVTPFPGVLLRMDGRELKSQPPIIQRLPDVSRHAEDVPQASPTTTSCGANDNNEGFYSKLIEARDEKGKHVFTVSDVDDWPDLELLNAMYGTELFLPFEAAPSTAPSAAAVEEDSQIMIDFSTMELIEPKIEHVD